MTVLERRCINTTNYLIPVGVTVSLSKTYRKKKKRGFIKCLEKLISTGLEGEKNQYITKEKKKPKHP